MPRLRPRKIIDMIHNSSFNPVVAYFSMEMMLETDVPTYAGGLGVLAGDILRSAADLKIPAVGMSIVYSGDTFSQILHPDGTQSFAKQDWQKLDQLTKLPHIIHVEVGDTRVSVGCWRYDITGLSGFTVPVYLLDTNLVVNPQWARDITKSLYAGGDTRICQEIILGIGGVRMLRALGLKNIGTYHLNEGHCAFVPLALMPEHDYKDEEVKKLCVFTSHTPIPEGHDRFSYDLAYRFASPHLPWHIKKLAGENELSMTHLALNLSRKAFAVSRKHQEVSNRLFPGYNFDYVTNGVHHRTWTHNYLQDVYNQYLPGWLDDPSLLKSSSDIPSFDLWTAHLECKRKLVTYVNRHLITDEQFDEATLTISLARRPVSYKRPLLLYHDIPRLLRAASGRLQIVQCGKSHPDDDVSQGIVKEIVHISQSLKHKIKIVFLENYSPKVSRLLVSGSDLWLNTPMRPLEASGTSGMKAILNGLPHFSVLDGWWVEGFAQNPDSGWTVGPQNSDTNDDTADAADLYTKLESEVLPLYYNRRQEWITKMKHSISLGSHFNSHRVAKEYLSKAWN